uniref:Uncharacterized protein n=1 Tax=Arundo donax TaxID=35708 RepID=A0A0A8YPF8_ARUDO
MCSQSYYLYWKVPAPFQLVMQKLWKLLTVSVYLLPSPHQRMMFLMP